MRKLFRRVYCASSYFVLNQLPQALNFAWTLDVTSQTQTRNEPCFSKQQKLEPNIAMLMPRKMQQHPLTSVMSLSEPFKLT